MKETVTIQNQRGLHARASAKFVQTAEQFNAVITVTCGEQTVGGTSIMGLLLLAASKGTEITVNTDGTQAKEALDALVQLVSDKFHEEA